MTTALNKKRVVLEATHQGIEDVHIHVHRNADMSVNPNASFVEIRVAEFSQEGRPINRREVRRTLAEMNAGGSALQQLKTETRGYYQFLEQLARGAGIIGQGTDSEDLA